jgi:xanthine dehydrogenase accessory factor
VLNEVYAEIARCLEQGVPVALATVAAARGSTPRKPGAKMVIKPDGSFCGTIGGGRGEAEVRHAAAEVLKTGVPQVVRVDPTDPAEGPNRTRGGTMEVFVERIAPE